MLEPKHFNRLLSNPESTADDDLEKLEQLLEDYPYLQSARALQLKIYKEKNSELYNDALRKTAAHTIDRDILFQFITSDLFTKKAGIKKLSQEIDINEIDIKIEEIKPESKKLEEILEINKPLSFNKEDSYSFSEWMQLTSHKPIERNTVEIEEDNSNKTLKTDKVIDLVDTFLKNNPRPKRAPEFFEENPLSTENAKAPQSLMTETLARVYLQQKNYKKAIQAYKILILKNSEKSGYFADKIRAIEKLTNKK